MIKKITLRKNQKEIIPLILFGREKDINYHIRLTHKGADITLLILLLGKDNHKLNINTEVVHEKPDTKSRIILKGVLDDFSDVSFDGLVKIQRKAVHSETELKVNLLLLSKNSRGKTNPKLEVSDNDVSASHASAVGKLNEKELFYIMSRGISRKSATDLLVKGFFESLINEFPEKEAKKAKKILKWK